MDIVYSLVILLFVILIHEFGHYAVAKLVGIGVTEFSIGMGPELYQVNKNGTNYSFRLFPMGGYVLLEGADEDAYEEYEDEKGKKRVRVIETDSPTSYRNSTIPKKIFTMLGGVVMNFLFAFILFSISANLVGVPTNTIGEFIKGLPAEKSELKLEDKIIEVNGSKIEKWEEISPALSDLKGDTAQFKVQREEETLDISVPLAMEDGRKIIGIYPKYRKASVGESVSGGIDLIKVYGGMIFGFLDKVTKGQAGVEGLSGPVGIVKTIGDAAKSGWENLIFFIAYINLNLGIFNLLPIPALDGSRILFLVLEAIRGKKVSEKVEGALLTVGVVFLIGLMLIVTYRDIIALFK